MDLEDADYNVNYLIPDQDDKYPATFDAILTDTGIETVHSRIRAPRKNSIMER